MTETTRRSQGRCAHCPAPADDRILCDHCAVLARVGIACSACGVTPSPVRCEPDGRDRSESVHRHGWP